MKKSHLAAIAVTAAFSLFACKDNPVDKTVTGLMDSKEKAASTADAANLSALKTALTAYMAANGRNPANLKELASFATMKIEEDKYDYDPATGDISLR